MNFTFSEEQDLLRSSARRFLQERYPPKRVAATADGEGFDRAEWAWAAELGWTGIAVPEEAGGAGLGFLEEAIVAEEMGRALYPGPFLSSVVLAAPFLRAGGAGELVRAMVAGERVATVAWAGEDGAFETDPPPKVDWDGDRLSAVKLFVPDVGVSDLLVMVGGTGDGAALWVVDREAPGVRWRELPTVDATRRMGEVILEGVAATRLDIDGAEALGALREVRDRALAALAAEALGAAGAALDLAVEHARARNQFGRPIGTFQAVSHPLATSYMEIETSKSLAFWAAWAVAEGAPEAGMAAAAAKARAAETAVAACERAIQVHGGMGFTWEHPLHRFYKRALGIRAFMGSGPELRRRVAAHLLDQGADGPG